MLEILKPSARILLNAHREQSDQFFKDLFDYVGLFVSKKDIPEIKRLIHENHEQLVVEGRFPYRRYLELHNPETFQKLEELLQPYLIEPKYTTKKLKKVFLINVLFHLLETELLSYRTVLVLIKELLDVDPSTYANFVSFHMFGVARSEKSANLSLLGYSRFLNQLSSVSKEEVLEDILDILARLVTDQVLSHKSIEDWRKFENFMLSEEVPLFYK